VYAVLPQSWLDGTADRSAVGLALKHDLIPVGAYFLGRSLLLRREQLVPLAWTLLGVAGVVALVGLVDDFFVSISWWRDSAVVDYFHKQLGYDYHGTGGLPENFIFNTGSEDHFLRRLVSVFLGPLASAYCFVAALIVAAALRRRLRILIPLCVLIAVALLFTFSRSSLLALAAGLVVLAYLQRRWWPVAAAVATLAVSVAWVHVFPHVAPEGHWTKQDLVLQRNNARQNPGASGNAGSINEPSLHSHWISLRAGARTVIHHPEGYGLGNAGQTASRTGTPIKAGESNYTEIGVETGLVGALLWIAWSLAVFVGLVRRCAAAIAAVFAAVLVLAIQTDVIGDPWVGYVVWAAAGIGLAEVALSGDDDRPTSRYRPRPPEGERPRVAAPLWRRGGIPVRRRVPPPHRAEHLGVEGRLAAAPEHDRALPRRHSLSRPGDARACRASGRRRRRPVDRRQRPRRQRGDLPPRSRLQRDRALPRPAPRAVA
jgi:hypothetical protein